MSALRAIGAVLCPCFCWQTSSPRWSSATLTAGTCGYARKTDEGAGVLEIKSLAVDPVYQGKGYGRALIEHVTHYYAGRFHTLQVGTGDSPLTVPFYERCGFTRGTVVPNFFLEHYDHPIIEAGVQLVDMVYLSRPLR